MEIPRRSIIDMGLLVLVNAMWATQYAGYKAATERMGPITLSAWTFLFATLALVPFLARERRRRLTANSSLEQASDAVTPGARSLLNKRNIIGFLVLGVVGLIPASALLAWGEKLSTASNASIIYLMAPIITAILASLILNEKITLVRCVSLFIALGGVLILSNTDLRHLRLTSGAFLFGNLLVLTACTAACFYNVYCKELLSRFTPLEVLVYGYSLGLIVTVPLLIWVEPLSLGSVQNYGLRIWLAVLVVSIVSYGLGMVLWAFLLKRLDVSQASISIYLMPFFGVLFSALTLNERITSTMIVGGLVTLAGTFLTTSLEPSSA